MKAPPRRSLPHPSPRAHSRALRRALLLAPAIASLVALGACGPRQVEVRAAPATQAEVAIHLTNGLRQAVNVYVNANGQDIFVRQVDANSTAHLPVQGIASGTQVTLRATTIDGRYTYDRKNVALSGTFPWSIP